MSSRILNSTVGAAAPPMDWQEGGMAGAGPSAAGEDPPAAAAGLDREWRERVEEAHAAGQREGHAEGRRRALEELRAEAQAVLDRLAQAIAAMAGLRGKLRREAEGDLLQLAVAVARRVLRREMSVDPGALRGLIMAALEKLESREIHRVRVHPAQAAPLEALLRERSGGRPIEVVADPSSEPGAVIFETERGNLDASVDTQLAEIERGLADRLKRHRA